MLKKIYIYILVLFISSSISGGNRIYVSSASEIAAAMSSAIPGDTLIMVNGFWTDQKIVFSGNGTSEQNIVLKAETPGFVILNGSSTLRIAGSHLTVDGLYFYQGSSTSNKGVIEFRNGSSNLANYCRLTGTAIENYNPSSRSIEYKWVSIYGTYNRVDHCYFRGKTNDGTTLVVWLDGQPNYHIIDSNYFGYRPELGLNGGETIRVGTSDYSMTDSYTTIENNYFERCNGEIEIISNKSGNNIYRYNTFFECEGALTLRHGNNARVHGNFFIGNNKTRTGGVRITGEDHKVYNNYFENLKGTSFRAALTMMNGVENSPLNRYFQVKRTEVVNNTFVNCEETFNIGAGNDSERTLPPLDCKISNNIARSNNRFIEYDDDPINMIYENNIMFDGPLGISETDGLSRVDPQLFQDIDGLWRLSETSPAVDSASTSYSYIVEDMDGHLRIGLPDIGADEYSMELITRKPLTPEVIGPAWYPPEQPPLKVIPVYAGQDSLKNAISVVKDYEIIELMTDGGVYSNTGELEITKDIIIRARRGLSNRPIITNNDINGSSRSIIVIKDGGKLKLQNLELDGMAGSDTPAKYIIRTDENLMTESYNLIIDSCYFHDVSIDGNGNFFRAYSGTFADSIVIENSLFTDCGKEGIRLKDEDAQSGYYNVNVFKVVNSTFWNIPQEAINIYAGDNVIFTPGPIIRIDHSTFDNCGYEGSNIILPLECDDTYISNSIFSHSGGPVAISLFGNNASIAYCDLYEVGDIELNRNATLGAGIIEIDPLYENRLEGNFTLPGHSRVLNKAINGSSLGDLRWAVNTPSFYSLTLVTYGEGMIETEPSNQTNDYDIGTSVTLTAVPNDGYEFVQWGGDASGTQDVLEITMDSNKEVVAVFQLVVSLADNTKIPREFNLFQNYPNPFNPTTRIRYGIPVKAYVKIDLFNTNGEFIKNLINSDHLAGNYEINWNASDYPSGIYILRMISGGKSFINKMLLIK